jgi:homogentisate phytyltransferase/homogentisate geranylgeranyltransferase
MMIGSCYSLPPIRLKRFPFWAAFCIFGVRGLVVNLGFYLYFSNLFGGFNQFPLASLFIPPEIWALSQFVILFTLAIAFLKDIPDLEGDRMFHVLTLTVRLGAGRVFRLSTWIIAVCYLLLISYAALGLLPSANPYFLILSQLGLLALFWMRSGRLDTSNLRQVRRYYQFIWKLFFLEYILVPLAILLPHH